MSELPLSHVMPHPISSDREGMAAQSWPIAAEGEVRNLKDYVWLIRKHLRLISACFLGTLFTTALTIHLTTPIYTAETTLLIEPNTPQVLGFREVLAESQGYGPYDFYKTQQEILKSRTLAARVIQEQRLQTDPVLTGERRAEGFAAGLLAQARGGVAAAQGWVWGFFQPPPSSDGENPPDVEPGLISAYRSMLNIRPIEGTQLVKIAFNSPDPQLSARMANAHAQAYIHQGLERRTQAGEEAQRFLQEKLVELKERVEKSEAALNRYRRDKGIISLEDKENIVVERLADLNKRLTEAEAERIGLESQVHMIRKGRYNYNSLNSLPAVINNSLIQALTGQMAHLNREYAYLSTQYKPAHPRLDQQKAQVEETQRRLHQETRRVVEGIESAYFTAEAKEKQVRAAMEAQKAAALSLKSASVEYVILAREVDTNRQLYDGVLQRIKETGVAAQLRSSLANVFIIDWAEPPQSPSTPKIGKNLLLGALLGLIGGVGLAFLREQLDNTLKSPEEAERYLHLPKLGMVPDFLSLDWRRSAQRSIPYKTPQIPSSLPAGEAPARGLSHHPVFVVAEAYRTLRTAILLSRAEEPPRTILFTSTMHGEGKTATVINTAIVFAQMGARVLVLDADLHRSRCHRVLGVQKGPGLTEILTGLREPQELPQPAYTAGLFCLSSGATPPNPTDLVGSKKMRDTLALLREQYDYILVDSPPVVSASDAALLSTMVEGVLLVVDVQATPKPLLKEARARLSYARAKMLGTVLNRVDIRTGIYAYYYQPYDAYAQDLEAEAHRH